MSSAEGAVSGFEDKLSRVLGDRQSNPEAGKRDRVR